MMGIGLMGANAATMVSRIVIMASQQGKPSYKAVLSQSRDSSSSAGSSAMPAIPLRWSSFLLLLHDGMNAQCQKGFGALDVDLDCRCHGTPRTRMAIVGV